MEIIKRGTPPAEKTWTGTCGACKSIVRAKTPELKITHDQRDGPWGTANCPVCKKEMFFHLKKE